MTDPKDSNLSPVGREWDNTLVHRPKWSLWRAALYGLMASVAVLVIDIIIVETGLGVWPADPILVVPYLVVRLGFFPLLFLIGAAIRNLWARTYQSPH